MLRLADSLALSRSQVEQMQAEERILLTRADTIYHALGSYLAALPRNFDPGDAAKRVNESNDAAWKLIYGEAPFIKSLLTSAQIRRLPNPLFNLITVPNFKGRFFGLF